RVPQHHRASRRGANVDALSTFPSRTGTRSGVIAGHRDGTSDIRTVPGVMEERRRRTARRQRSPERASPIGFAITRRDSDDEVLVARRIAANDVRRAATRRAPISRARAEEPYAAADGARARSVAAAPERTRWSVAWTHPRPCARRAGDAAAARRSRPPSEAPEARRRRATRRARRPDAGRGDARSAGRRSPDTGGGAHPARDDRSASSTSDLAS